MPRRLIGQRVGERDADRTVLRADQEVDVGDLVAFADQGLADVHEDVAGHSSVSPWSKLGVLNRQTGPGFSPHRPSGHRAKESLRVGNDPVLEFA